MTTENITISECVNNFNSSFYIDYGTNGREVRNIIIYDIDTKNVVGAISRSCYRKGTFVENSFTCDIAKKPTKKLEFNNSCFFVKRKPNNWDVGYDFFIPSNAINMETICRKRYYISGNVGVETTFNTIFGEFSIIDWYKFTEKEQNIIDDMKKKIDDIEKYHVRYIGSKAQDKKEYVELMENLKLIEEYATIINNITIMPHTLTDDELFNVVGIASNNTNVMYIIENELTLDK